MVRTEKPRLFQSTRDIILSLGLLLLIMVFVVGGTGLCSFNPGGPDKYKVTNPVDVSRILQMDAAGLSFPVRDPQVPEGWTASMSRRVTLGQRISVATGWVIADKESFIQLIQTDAQLNEVGENFQDGVYRELSGSKTIDGVDWQIFSWEDENPVWGADLGDVRLFISGKTDEESMAQLAKIVVNTPPINPEAEYKQN